MMISLCENCPYLPSKARKFALRTWATLRLEFVENLFRKLPLKWIFFAW